MPSSSCIGNLAEAEFAVRLSQVLETFCEMLSLTSATDILGDNELLNEIRTISTDFEVTAKDSDIGKFARIIKRNRLKDFAFKHFSILVIIP